MSVRLTTETSTESGRDIGRSLRQLAQRFAGPDGVVVGIPEGSGGYENGPLFAVVGAVNEFGSANGRIPPRPHLGPGVSEASEEIAEVLRQGLIEVANERATPEQILNRVGLVAVASVQQKIVDVRQPPNAPSTIARKRSSNPLIDIGSYRQAINYQILEAGEPFEEGL